MIYGYVLLSFCNIFVSAPSSDHWIHVALKCCWKTECPNYWAFSRNNTILQSNSESIYTWTVHLKLCQLITPKDININWKRNCQKRQKLLTQSHQSLSISLIFKIHYSFISSHYFIFFSSLLSLQAKQSVMQVWILSCSPSLTSTSPGMEKK